MESNEEKDPAREEKTMLVEDLDACMSSEKM